jgi:anti-sigma B factor antagonist
MDLEAAIEHIDPATAVVTVTGALRSGDLNPINMLLQQLIAGGVTRLVLDLTACPYVDSAGLGTLLHTFGLLSERHGQLRLCGANQRIEDLILMTHTHTLLHRDPTREASLASLGS